MDNTGLEKMRENIQILEALKSVGELIAKNSVKDFIERNELCPEAVVSLNNLIQTSNKMGWLEGQIKVSNDILDATSGDDLI